MATEKRTTEQADWSRIDELLDILSKDTFQDWFRERQYRQNIENGTPYFNGPGDIPEPEKHSPSSLLQCHRKIFYRQYNSPAEQADPHGIFWFGTRFEEDIVFPFLERAVTGPNTYVRNTIWVDTSVETDAGEVHIKGATDPIIVDRDSTPILLTEVKTKSSIEHVDAPNRHHLAQVHAYLIGLSEKYEVEVTDAAIIYGSRESLDIKVFHVEFDSRFWEDVVLEWAVDHTRYRLEEELPSAKPEYEWECEFCDYRERCGEGEYESHGYEPSGFLPLFDEYPRDRVIEYLKAHDEQKLTPTLAHNFPKLASQYGNHDWYCTVCGTSQSVETTEWGGNPERPPLCQSCGEDGVCATLAGPRPELQAQEGYFEEDSDA